MKQVLAYLLPIATVSIFSASAFADWPKPNTPDEKLCLSFEDQYETQCAHIMCDDSIQDGTFKDLADCTSASDYGEAAQATCEDIPQIGDLAEQYNRAHPGSRLTCD